MSKEENNIPQPFYFESENFSSAYFGKIPADISRKSGGKTDMKLIHSLVLQLTDEREKENRTKVLSMLRDNNAQELLMGIVRMKQHAKHRSALLSACWETGLDYSAHVKDIARLAVDGDYSSALECMTLITENMNEEIPAVTLEEAIATIRAGIEKKDERQQVFSMILDSLTSKPD